MRGNKEEFRKAGGPFGLLKADFNLWWGSWKRLRQAKKHYKNLLKKRPDHRKDLPGDPFWKAYG